VDGIRIDLREVYEISSSHGGEYDVQSCLLGCTAVLNNFRPTVMMEAVRTSETSVDNYFTRQYNPENNSEQILGKLVGGVEWIRFAQDRDRWRAVVKAVMNLSRSDATELVYNSVKTQIKCQVRYR
jgi:hypothetical protein